MTVTVRSACVLSLSSLALFLGCAGAPSVAPTGGAGGSTPTTSSTGGEGGTILPIADAAPPKSVCGNFKCEDDETCEACPTDCGQCPACNAAPSCSLGVALPSQPGTLTFEELSAPAASATAGVPDGGFPPATDCGGAQLRMRISRIEVDHQGKEVWLPTGTLDGPAQTYYCLVQASDGAVVTTSDAGTNGTIEVALTKPTAAIPDHGSADFGPADSIFWGQAGPRLTQNNLTITYSCFQQAQAGSNSWAAVLSAAGAAAGTVAGAGPYGWAFGLADVALQTASAAITASQQQGDWHMFDVTQTIDRSWLIPLTNGYVWSFHRGGGDAAFKYPWGITVYVESWGCADVHPGTAP